MAGEWSKDGAVQDQIDASVKDAIKMAKSLLPKWDSLTHCEECEAVIPQARRDAIPDVHLCVKYQSELNEQKKKSLNLFNCRGSKNS